MRGSVYGEAGHADQALADFNKAISLDPNYAQAYANRALIYRKTNKLDLALADDNKALAIDASYAPAYLGRGIVYRLQGRNAQALDDFNKVIAIRPDNAEAYYNRGLLYQSQGQQQFAIDDFSTALGLTTQKCRTVRRACAQLSGNRRRQVGGERSRPGCAVGSAESARPGPAAVSPTSALGRRTRPPVPMRKRSTSTTNTSRQKPASPGSAARLGSRIRLFEHDRKSRRQFSERIMLPA